MPLQRGKVLGYDFNRMVVDFTMFNQGKTVRCAHRAAEETDLLADLPSPSCLPSRSSIAAPPPTFQKRPGRARCSFDRTVQREAAPVGTTSRPRGPCLCRLASLRMVVGQGAGCGVPAFRAFMTKCSQSP
jgi:hypothetical protein